MITNPNYKHIDPFYPPQWAEQDEQEKLSAEDDRDFFLDIVGRAERGE